MSVSYDEGEEGKEGKKCLDEEEEEAEIPKHPTPPDGGWGWWVVLASFTCNVIVDGVCMSYGVVAMEYEKVFDAPHSLVWWVGSSLAGCYLLVGPFVSAMCARYGCRRVTMAGSIITMLGFALSTQSKNVEMLIFTYGVIGGIGFGMIYLPSIVCVGHWFEKKRAFTTGIVVAGTGVGQFVFPPLVHYLLVEYGWEGTNLILAGIVLYCAVCGMTFLPLDRHPVKPYRRVKSKVTIQRGAIMNALIEDKRRQRTISNGSLDNCIITRDNRLIKVDPRIFDCKRNNSFIARFKRQLGFSTQSLACSKNSLPGIPSIVIDAVHKDLIKSSGSPIYRPKGLVVQDGLSQSPLVQKRGSLPDGYMVVSSTLVPNESTQVTDSSQLLNGVAKTRSCDVIPKEDMSWMQSQDEGITFTVKHISGVPSVTRSSSDLDSEPAQSPAIEGSVISIQVIENSCTQAQGMRQSMRYRPCLTVSNSYNAQMSVSGTTYSSGTTAASIPQMHASVEEEDFEVNRHQSILWKCWQVGRDMVDIRLMLNPVFALLVVSSFVTLLAYFIPFFFLPEKGESVGMGKAAAAFLLSIMGITNTIGRIVCGWLVDRPWVNTLHFNNCTIILAGVAILLCPLCEDEVSLAFIAAIFGLCQAIYVSLRPILLVDLLGLDLLTKSFGLHILFQGVAAFIGAPIAGDLIKSTGNINDCFYLAGGLTILSGLLMLPILHFRRPATKKKSIPQMPRDTPITEILKLENI